MNTNTHTERAPRRRRPGPGRPVGGRRKIVSPGVEMSIRGIPEIHAALKARFGFAPCLSTLYAVLHGERENEALVRTVAGMFPGAILPAVAARYGIPVDLSALGAEEGKNAPR